jgi:hypothetical protein
MALNESNSEGAGTVDILDRVIPIAGVVSAIIMAVLVFIGAGGTRTVKANNQAAVISAPAAENASFIPVGLR